LELLVKQIFAFDNLFAHQPITTIHNSKMCHSGTLSFLSRIMLICLIFHGEPWTLRSLIFLVQILIKKYRQFIIFLQHYCPSSISNNLNSPKWGSLCPSSCSFLTSHNILIFNSHMGEYMYYFHMLVPPTLISFSL